MSASVTTHVKLAFKYPRCAIRYFLRKKIFVSTLGVGEKQVRRIYEELYSKELLYRVNSKLKLIGFKRDVRSMRQAELYVLCRLLRPRRVVETGIEHGISSMFILMALEDNGVGGLCSIEILNFLPDGKKVGWLVPAELRRRWRLFIGNSLNILPDLLLKMGKIDVFMHDSEHTYDTMFQEYSLAWPFVKQAGFLLSDDTGRNEAFIHFCKRVGRVSPAWTERGYGFIQK